MKSLYLTLVLFFFSISNSFGQISDKSKLYKTNEGSLFFEDLKIPTFNSHIYKSLPGYFLNELSQTDMEDMASIKHQPNQIEFNIFDARMPVFELKSDAIMPFANIDTSGEYTLLRKKIIIRERSQSKQR